MIGGLVWFESSWPLFVFIVVRKCVFCYRHQCVDWFLVVTSLIYFLCSCCMNVCLSNALMCSNTLYIQNAANANHWHSETVTVSWHIKLLCTNLDAKLCTTSCILFSFFSGGPHWTRCADTRNPCGAAGHDVCSYTCYVHAKYTSSRGWTRSPTGHIRQRLNTEAESHTWSLR